MFEVRFRLIPDEGLFHEIHNAEIINDSEKRLTGFHHLITRNIVESK